MARGALSALYRLSLAFLAGILVLSVLAAADVVPGKTHSDIPVAGLSAAQIEEQLQVNNGINYTIIILDLIMLTFTTLYSNAFSFKH
jgi:hypothetical protein